MGAQPQLARHRTNLRHPTELHSSEGAPIPIPPPQMHLLSLRRLSAVSRRAVTERIAPSPLGYMVASIVKQCRTAVRANTFQYPLELQARCTFGEVFLAPDRYGQ